MIIRGRLLLQCSEIENSVLEKSIRKLCFFEYVMMQVRKFGIVTTQAGSYRQG